MQCSILNVGNSVVFIINIFDVSHKDSLMYSMMDEDF